MSWERVRLGDIATVYDGPHATPKAAESGPVFLGISSLDQGHLDLSQSKYISEEDFERWTKRVQPQPGDIVFSYETRLGQAAIIPPGLRCCLGRRLGLLRPDRSLVDPHFLLYKYLSPQFQEFLMSRVNPGSTVDRILLKEVPNYSIQIPSIEEQKKISNCIYCLDKKIYLNKELNETLEAMARAIFKDWFIDFGPVRAKEGGREPYLNDEIWNLFPDGLDEQGKPAGWGVSTIGQEVDVVGGSTPSTKKPEFWNGDIAWATPKDLAGLSAPVLIETTRNISKDGLSQISSGLLPRGTVLLSSRAPIGYTAIADIQVAINQGFIAMRCDKRLPNTFVWLWTMENIEVIKRNANGSTFQEISKKNFRPISVLVPDEVVLKAFDDLVRPLVDRIRENQQQKRTLADMRDFLLPKLMSGRFTIRDSEPVMEKAV